MLKLGGNFNVTVQANEGSGSAHVGNDKVITIDEDEPTLKKRRIQTFKSRDKNTLELECDRIKLKRVQLTHSV